MSDIQDAIPADRFLLMQLARENPWALEALMRRHESRVYQFIYNLVKSAEQAEEITQDIFIKLWASRDELSHIESLPAWLYTVSRNRARNALKERASRYIREENYAATLDAEVDGEAEIHYREMRHVMADFVDTLPPRRRTIFRLKTEEGLTTEEIGRQLNISPHTVKNQLSQSYLTLRRLMRESAYSLFWTTVLINDFLTKL
ncbi:RNA polymerase sigma factor [Parapedobacter lycopersici]|uniref:RNA polymerase sigma factor n=1 Tax=Parapedobacter lycopersici TaxID=1864939 RepID=UPI00214DECE3|nr:RNA polymerase sigma-70 factor [Parapedobacter lycopersici]